MLVLGSAPADTPAGNTGLVNFMGFACIAPLTMIFAPIGAALASNLPAARLKTLFDIVLLVTGLRMLRQSVLSG